MYEPSNQAVQASNNIAHGNNTNAAFIIMICVTCLMGIFLFVGIPVAIHKWYRRQSRRVSRPVLSKTRLLWAWYLSVLPLFLGLILFTMFISNNTTNHNANQGKMNPNSQYNYNYHGPMQVSSYKLNLQEGIRYGGLSNNPVAEVAAAVSVQWEKISNENNNNNNHNSSSPTDDMETLGDSKWCTSITVYTPCNIKTDCDSVVGCTEEDWKLSLTFVQTCIEESLQQSTESLLSFVHDYDSHYTIVVNDTNNNNHDSISHHLPTLVFYGNSEICHAKYTSKRTLNHAEQLILGGALSSIGFLLIINFILGKATWTENLHDDETECSSVGSNLEENDNDDNSGDVATTTKKNNKEKDSSTTEHETETSSTGDNESSSMTITIMEDRIERNTNDLDV